MHAHHTHHRGVSGSEISIAMFLMNMHANMTMPGDATAVADHAMSPWSQRHTTMSNISFVTATVTKYLRGGGVRVCVVGDGNEKRRDTTLRRVQAWAYSVAWWWKSSGTEMLQLNVQWERRIGGANTVRVARHADVRESLTHLVCK